FLSDGTGTWRDIYNIRADRGNSVYDRRHKFVGTLIYNLPFRHGSAVVNGIIGGWQASAISSLRSGRFISVTVTGNPANSSGTNYANRLHEGTLPAGERNIDRWWDLTAFSIPAQYTYGNGGRDILPGPSFVNLDLKIGKNFRIRERYRLEFRAEMF